MYARRLAAKHQGSDRPDYVLALFGGRHDSVIGTEQRRWIVFHCNWASFLESGEMQIDMPLVDMSLVCTLEERPHIAHLLTLVDSPKVVGGLSHQVKISTVLEKPFDIWPSLKNLGRGGAIGSFIVKCEQLFVSQLRNGTKLKFFSGSPCLVVGRFIHQLASKGPAISVVAN